MLRGTILIFVTIAALVDATQVSECGTGKLYEDANQVEISGCTEPPCKLKRRTQIVVQQKFTPEQDVKTLTTSVQATVFGASLPFIGVDGMSACNDIYSPDGSKVGCPLKKGNEYLYKNSFPILPVYPTISTRVHYALLEGNNVITCFEVDSKITN